LSLQPEIFLANEPTANLDVENKRKVVKLLHEYFTFTKKAIVVVTHDIFMIKPNHKVIILKNGTIHKDFVMTNYDLKRLGE